MKCLQTLESLVLIPIEGWLYVLIPPCFIILCNTCLAMSLPSIYSFLTIALGMVAEVNLEFQQTKVPNLERMKITMCQ